MAKINESFDNADKSKGERKGRGREREGEIVRKREEQKDWKDPSSSKNKRWCKSKLLKKTTFCGRSGVSCPPTLPSHEIKGIWFKRRWWVQLSHHLTWPFENTQFFWKNYYLVTWESARGRQNHVYRRKQIVFCFSDCIVFDYFNKILFFKADLCQMLCIL